MPTIYIPTSLLNSVNFETGKKLHQPPDTIRKLRLSSDNICLAHGQEILPTYTHGRSQTMSRAERRAVQKGTSWKRKLATDIDICMSKSKNQDEFIYLMETLRYRVKWTDSRKNITYTNPDGQKCRDDRLHNPKYLKANMEQEFENRYYQNSEVKTGWEYQSKNVARPMDIKGIGRELLWQANSLAYAVDDDEDIAIIGAIALATALSFAGVYLLLQKLNGQTDETITDDFVRQEVEQLLQEPENQMGYEEEVEQVYTQRSGMTMGGFR